MMSIAEAVCGSLSQYFAEYKMWKAFLPSGTVSLCLYNYMFSIRRSNLLIFKLQIFPALCRVPESKQTTYSIGNSSFVREDSSFTCFQPWLSTIKEKGCFGINIHGKLY